MRYNIQEPQIQNTAHICSVCFPSLMLPLNEPKISNKGDDDFQTHNNSGGY